MSESQNNVLTILPDPEATPSSSRRGWLFPASIGVVIALLVGMTVVVGRGTLFGAGAPSGGLSLVHATADKTYGLGTSKFDLTMTVGDGSRRASMTGSGVSDYDNRSGSVSLRSADTGDMTIVYVRDVIYMQMPTSLTDMFPGTGSTRRWIKLDLSRLPKGLQSNNMLPGQLFGNPSALLQALPMTRNAKRVGTDTVRGVVTTHYAATASLADLVAAWSTSTIKRYDVTALKGNEQIDVWIDSKGLTRRLQTTFTVPDLGTAAFSIDYYGFGQPVTVNPPPSNQVLDFASILGSLTGTAPTAPTRP